MPSISIMSRGATFALAFLLGDAADGASSLRGEQEYSNESAFVQLARATHNFCVGPDHKWRCETPCEFASQPCIDNYGAGSDCWVDQHQECEAPEPPSSTGNFCVGPDQKWRCETPCEFASQPCIDKHGTGSDCWVDQHQECEAPEPPSSTGNFCVGPDQKWRCETPCEFASQPCIDKYGAGADCWVDQHQECEAPEPPSSTGNFCVGPDQKWRCETPCEFASQPCIDKYGAGSDCWVNQLRECSSVTPPPSGAMGEVVATYIAARPSNLLPPPLSSIPSDVNLVMVCFAKNSPTGHFVSYDPQLWRSLDIGGSKRSQPRRKFLISLGGAAAWGGRFEIRGSLDAWVSNAVRSVEALIKEYSADGAEMQWEGNTGHSLFQPAVTRLLAELKGRGYTTATGPFYGGTSRDYAKLPLDNVDYINMQMYAMNIQSVDRLARGVEAAIAEYPVGSRATARAKFVLGLNSDNRNPNPKVGLTTLKSVGSIAGVFTWDAEHSATTMQPHWCIERLGAQILRGGSPSIDCRWR